jgi:AmmeMemoRadiSam system protein A
MRVQTIVLSTLVAFAACTSKPPVRTTEAGPDISSPPVAADTGSVEVAPSARPGPTEGAQAGEGPTDAEKRLLLFLARTNIARRLQDLDWPQLDASCTTPYLQQPLACFVTLNTKDGNLRGCIGMFESQDPLYRNVMDRALAAAFGDPRFTAVRADELPELVLEISILTQPQPFAFSSPEDLLARLRPLVDGVILHSQWGSSTFLPQVWEQLPDKQEFLGRLCEKHGAPAECWRDSGLRVETYQAIVFSEKDMSFPERDWFSLADDGTVRCTAAP